MAAGSSYRLIGAFSQYQQRRNLRPRTIDARRSALRMFVAFYGGDLLSATWKDIDRWLDSRPLKPKSRADYISYLHCFYAWAIREELTERDPTVRVAVPRVPKRLPRPIGEDALAVACRTADVRMLAMLALASYSGLRCMEIANLRAEDFIWSSPVVILVNEGKGAKDRVVPLAKRAELALRAYGLPAQGPVFAKRNGKPYTPATISSMINRHLRESGVGATAHQLRHRFGSRLYSVSKDIVLTQEMMGHSSIVTTRGYVAFCPDEAARYVDEM